MLSCLSRSMPSDSQRIVCDWKITLVHKVYMERLRRGIKVTREKQAELRSATLHKQLSRKFT